MRQSLDVIRVCDASNEVETRRQCRIRLVDRVRMNFFIQIRFTWKTTSKYIIQSDRLILPPLAVRHLHMVHWPLAFYMDRCVSQEKYTKINSHFRVDNFNSRRVERVNGCQIFHSILFSFGFRCGDWGRTKNRHGFDVTMWHYSIMICAVINLQLLSLKLRYGRRVMGGGAQRGEKEKKREHKKVIPQHLHFQFITDSMHIKAWGEKNHSAHVIDDSDLTSYCLTQETHFNYT